MRLRLSGATLRAALLRPEPLIGLLLLLATILFLAGALRGASVAQTTVEVKASQQAELQTSEVRLVSYDASGLERPSFATVALPESPAARIEAVMAALREQMLEQGWPEELPLPTVYVESVARRPVAVLDFRPRTPLSLTVAAEGRLLRSIQETALANGVDRVRYLLNGEAAGVFLEHLAVPSTL